MPEKLGTLLVNAGHLTPAQLDEAAEHARQDGGSLSSAVVALQMVTDAEIATVLSGAHRFPSIDLASITVETTVLERLPAGFARKYTVMPVARKGPRLTLAMCDPTNLFAIDDARRRAGCNTVEIVVASENVILDAIERHYGSETALVPVGGLAGPEAEEKAEEPLNPEDFTGLDSLVEIGADAMVEEEPEGELEDEDSIDLADLNRSAADSSTVSLMNRLLVLSVQRGASDIHIEPYEKFLRVRFRVDGVLEEIVKLPNAARDPLLQRVKIMAKLDIAERRLPQGGRFKRTLRLEGRSRELDYRVSVLPTLRGEKAVLRLLDKSNLMLDMTRLGFEPASLERFEAAIAKPYGIVLVTGPTGSGKTNTLYSALTALNKKDTNIMTAEDPVEFELEGVNQVQIRENVGLNFASALREFLRQDPNVVLVGEIRDYETAEIAIKASLTGHLVLSTLHTNDAPSTVSRLVNMGIEPFLVGTAVNLIQAQRLVRRICPKCKRDVTDEIPKRALLESGFAPEEIDAVRVHAGRGCEACRGTGFKGRVGLYEVMEVSDAIRDLVMVGATAVEIQKKALEEGMLTLRMSGLQKVRDGVTTLDEVLKETVL
ncbi:MAG: type IV-A pilus assembly ATPase PilB [Acidobacteria bacterium]|nr:type IV-A pilus assembly ATPase PilB [Acidobacteriota bacterium]